jgi:hypothetical protein
LILDKIEIRKRGLSYVKGTNRVAEDEALRKNFPMAGCQSDSTIEMASGGDF